MCVVICHLFFIIFLFFHSHPSHQFSLSSSSSQGDIPLVVKVDSADIMATLVNLKREFEGINKSHHLRLTFSGAAEAHLLAEEIAKAGISVILTSPRSYPYVWEQRRM